MNAIEVQHASFGPNGIFRIPRFELRQSEKVLLMGPSGCGKTSFLEYLAGFREGTASKLFVDTRAVVFQDLNLIDAFSIHENLALELTPEQIPGALRSLAELELTPSSRSLAKHLSKGEQQRLAVVRAVTKKSPLLLADEPTSHLDRHRADQLMELLCRSASSALIVSHDPHLERFFDRVLRFEDIAK